jgi:hypothetical protein
MRKGIELGRVEPDRPGQRQARLFLDRSAMGTGASPQDLKHGFVNLTQEIVEHSKTFNETAA